MGAIETDSEHGGQCVLYSGIRLRIVGVEDDDSVPCYWAIALVHIALYPLARTRTTCTLWDGMVATRGEVVSIHLNPLLAPHL